MSFLKALRERNVDALLQTTTLPFLIDQRGKQTVLQSQAEVKAWLQEGIATPTDPKKVASVIVRVEPLPLSKKAANPEEQESLDRAVKTIGGSGYFIMVGKDKMNEDFMLLIARKNGEIRVAGVLP